MVSLVSCWCFCLPLQSIKPIQRIYPGSREGCHATSFNRWTSADRLNSKIDKEHSLLIVSETNVLH